MVMLRLKTRIGKDGVLRVISQQTRSQVTNKELASGQVWVLSVLEK